jgi:hypothetical protein
MSQVEAGHTIVGTNNVRTKFHHASATTGRLVDVILLPTAASWCGEPSLFKNASYNQLTSSHPINST